ncbi:hypothetical protein SKB45_001375 [Salmonella enterica]|uniref:Fimbrial adhesin MrpH C-terminal domain-containing protein n=1 Tax=Salmonella enterica subsp. enterica serovar Sandiego TaxID=1151002 RepID=A0A609NN97_SALET|nr:hypothetical protein [Salmonella enterica]EBS4769659.1 hypothetical protein [Salmonella enterica subsp. enterica serovar Sandiego]ECH8235011.1 hypothetical protein [Salmonella enterica subsp. enterica]EIB5177278.1 hypothetical protein [Salmonella enterica subsp. enterica serovar Maracaibo]EAB4021045.1 hypothetical protein [Salmonella enterica]EAM1780515.1 hypothetical protein [Salmonella enterica]
MRSSVFCILSPLLMIGSLHTASAADYPVLNISSEAVIDAYVTGKITHGAVYSYRVDNNITGTVQCPSPSLASENAWHAVTIQLPWSTELNRYVVNENVSAAIRLPSRFPQTETWINYASLTCNESQAGKQISASQLGNAFPMYIDFYLDKATVDGFVSIPPISLGSYSRIFSDSSSGPTYSVGSIKTIPIRINRLEIQLPASCTVSPQSITIDHGVISARKNSLASEKLNIQCDKNVNVEFRLSATDGTITPEKHLQLPLRSTIDNKIPSELYLSNVSGQDLGYQYKFAAQQDNVINFHINSFISAENNISSGQFSGSAWLVAYIQ